MVDRWALLGLIALEWFDNLWTTSNLYGVWRLSRCRSVAVNLANNFLSGRTRYRVSSSTRV